MRDFSRAATTGLKLDAGKRVNYTRGLVLGPDEFLQEQFFGLSKHRRHNYSLHGYGTVWGLRMVPPDAGSGDPELQVMPGLAVDPCGREIEVPYTMCARLNDWLNTNREKVAGGGAPPAEVRLRAVLCYRECGTDKVPVSGEPCRTQEDIIQPSRIAESFELSLHLCPPGSIGSFPTSLPGDAVSPLMSQPEEMAARAFGVLLDRIEVRAGAPPGDYQSQDTLDAEVRLITQFVGADESGATLPWPPTDTSPLLIRPEDACSALRGMLRVWVTEVRPQVRRRQRHLDEQTSPGCQGGCCVLLGEIAVPIVVNPTGWAVGTGVQIDETDRPYLLHTRLLQEWLACANGAVQAASGGTPSPPAPAQPYRTVAAGRVTGTGNLIGPGLNGTVVSQDGTQPHEYTIRFNGYAPPGTSHSYVVTGTPILRTNPAQGQGYFRVLDFQAAGVGVRVRVTRTAPLNNPVPLAATDEFMFEIGRIG